ncbi:MAG TPA: transcriptional regulator [Bryobacteraceae bacterium]|jgi:DNA-binding MarR family transcriptional regulator
MAKQSSAAAAAAAPLDAKSEETPVIKRAGPTVVSKTTLPDLDRIIHERIRLGIISALAANPSLTFNDLKKLLDTTDGNLSVHARKLEEAGYIRCSKSFEGRMPKTEYRLTEEGSRALTKYIDHMEALIQSMRVHHPQ